MEDYELKRNSLRDLLQTVFKRKGQVAVFFLAFVLAVVFFTFSADPVYESASKILVKVGRENFYMPTVAATGSQSPTINFSREEQINSEIEILTSQALVERVAGHIGPARIYKDLGLEDESTGLRQDSLHSAVSRLKNNLKVQAVSKSNVVQISFRHKDPHMASDVVNTLVELYLDRHLEVHRVPQHDFFKDQAEMLLSRLRQAENRLENFKKEHNVAALDQERSLLLNREAALRAESNQTVSQIAETENRIKNLKEQLAVTPREVPQEEEVEHSPVLINTLQARLVELELKEKELLTKYTEQSRFVQNVREELSIVRAKLKEQESKKYGRSRSGLNSTYVLLQQELSRNQTELGALKAKDETKRVQMTDYKSRLQHLNGIELRLKELQRQVDVNEQNYKLYLAKYEENRISNAMDTEKIVSVSRIEPAIASLDPVSPKTRRNLILGFILGGFGALGFAFFMDYFDETLGSPEETEKALSLPVLATIPELKK